MSIVTRNEQHLHEDQLAVGASRFSTTLVQTAVANRDTAVRVAGYRWKVSGIASNLRVVLTDAQMTELADALIDLVEGGRP